MTSVASLALALAMGGPQPHDAFIEPPMFEIGVAPSCDRMADCDIFPDRPHCDTNSGECVQCLGDEHCDEGWSCGERQICEDTCRSDDECEDIGGRGVCNLETSTCLECTVDEHCPEPEFCLRGECEPDYCTPGQLLCLGPAILQCAANGATTTELQICEHSCVMLDGGKAECGPPPATSDGDTGASGDEAGATGSSTGASGSTFGGSTGDGSTGSTPATTGASQDDPAPSQGCGCRNGSSPTGLGPWLLLFVAWLRPRDARRSPRHRGRDRE
ncbi:MAG: hypothetical protein AAF799_07040 [Myxococcota bacterium]